jgi:hypothetical protein
MVQAFVNSIRARERQALIAEIKSLRDDVYAAAVEADRLRIAIKAAVDALPESSAELVAEALRDALAEAEPPVTA